VSKTLSDLLAEVSAGLAARDAELSQRDTELAARESELRQRAPSRFVGPDATPAGAAAVTARHEGGELSARSAPRGASTGRQRLAKAMAEGTGSAGGFLVEQEVADEVLRLIRARSSVMRMGVRVVPVRKELALTSVSSGAAAYYGLEGAHIAPSEMTFSQQVLLQPKGLAALVPVSNRLLRDARDTPDAADVITEDLAEIMALRADLAFLQGTGTAAEPLGIKNKPGITAGPSLGANGRALTFDDLKNIVAAAREVGGSFLNPGWVLAPRTLSSIERIKDADGHYLGDEAGLLSYDARGGGGTLLGFPFVTSKQVPTTLTTGTSTDTSYLIFSSDWQEAWVGEEQDFTLERSTEAAYTTDGGTTWVSAFQAQQTLFRCTMHHDIALRRPGFFVVTTGIRPLA
jgi:HK97 family phage major capsid protein